MPYRNGKIVDWKVKVKGIRSLLNSDCSDENAIKTGKEIYKTLTNSIYKKYFENFDILEDFNNVLGLEDFNGMLNEMYDYCDTNLIWIDFD